MRRRACQGLPGGLLIKSGCCMCIMLSNLDSFLPGFSYLTRIDEVEKRKERRDTETGTGVIFGVGRVYIKAFRSQFYHFLASSTLLNTRGEDVALPCE